MPSRLTPRCAWSELHTSITLPPDYFLLCPFFYYSVGLWIVNSCSDAECYVGVFSSAELSLEHHPPTNRRSVHQGISCSLVHISIRKQLFCHDEHEMVGHTSVLSTPPLFRPLGCCRNRYSILQSWLTSYWIEYERKEQCHWCHTPVWHDCAIPWCPSTPLMIFGLFILFYYQINVGTSCPGCNGWEYICFVDTPPNHPCGTRKMLYVFIDQNLKWMSCVWWRNRHADAVCINHEILFSRLASPPPIGFGEIPHNLNLVHKSLLYILPCLLCLPRLGCGCSWHRDCNSTW